MAELTLKAYPVSEMQQKKLKEKFRAFSSADLSERAKKEGAFKSDRYGTGWYFTRSSGAGSSSRVLCVSTNGGLIWNRIDSDNAGLRVALQVIYNPNNSPAKGCRSEKRTAKIWNKEKSRDKEVTSKAPIVTFGKKQYIWLNKEECEAGTAQTMELVSLELVARSVPFDKNCDTNDFAKAEEMHKQYFEVVKDGCSEDELAMIVPAVMSEKDDYNSATPVLFTKEQQEWQDKIRENPNEFLNLPTEMFANESFVCACLDIAKETIRQETMRLEEVTDEYVESVGEQLKAFSKKIEKEKEEINKRNEKTEKSNRNRESVLAMLNGKDKGEGK